MTDAMAASTRLPNCSVVPRAQVALYVPLPTVHIGLGVAVGAGGGPDAPPQPDVIGPRSRAAAATGTSFRTRTEAWRGFIDDRSSRARAQEDRGVLQGGQPR